ncbi:hypothetical protein H2199_005043 [Coniosporium tulheliwenetii]|uniref:Uncharacterized protein n=1 Tax=Coniosporium tulheliwenetii TaxID=3383036 RepID=A0ACC2Z2C6_9PEZI|nr:hypothetical protein H2199_005043 [Cladosporium sp. JES 115]
MDDAVAALLTASKTPAKQRKNKTSAIIEDLCNRAFQDGLNRRQLHAVVDIVTRRTELDQASTNAVVKNLYPADKISSATVVVVVGALGPGRSKPSTSTQVALTRWLTLVFEALEDRTVLSRLYGVLFNLLDILALRAPLCYLLSLVTHRKHVRLFRVHQLLELSRVAGNEPALEGLLRVYKDHCPDIIVGTTTSARTSLPPVGALQYGNGQYAKFFSSQIRSGELDYSPSKTRPREIPTIRRCNNMDFMWRDTVSSAVKSQLYQKYTPIGPTNSPQSTATLEEISSVDSFVDNLDKIELPTQMMSSLRDPLLQKYLTLNPSEIASKRTEFWLLAYLEEELETVSRNIGQSAHLTDILNGVLDYAKATKTLPPAIEVFLARYLPYWDGRSDVGTILELLSYVSNGTFRDFRDTYLNAAETAVLTNNLDSHPRLLDFYTQLARHRSALASPSSHAYVTSKQFLAELAEHVSRFISAVLSSGEIHPATVSASLSFYENLSSLAYSVDSEGGSDAHIILPPPHVAYLFLSSSSLADVSRLCSILAALKAAFEANMGSSRFSREFTNQFNGYLMDVCNLLWRSRALLTSDANAMGCLFPENAKPALQSYLQDIDHEYALASMFGLSHNHLLTAMSISALRTLEDRAEGLSEELHVRHAGPATQRSLVVLGNEGVWTSHGRNIELRFWIGLMPGG